MEVSHPADSDQLVFVMSCGMPRELMTVCRFCMHAPVARANGDYLKQGISHLLYGAQLIQHSQSLLQTQIQSFVAVRSLNLHDNALQK